LFLSVFDGGPVPLGVGQSIDLDKKSAARHRRLMICDQCAKETPEGVSQEWMGGSVASRSTYGATLGGGTVSETIYDNFIPIPTFLCATCYEPRAKMARRNVGVWALLGLVGIGLLVLAYILLVSNFEVPIPVFWRNLTGWLAVLVGFLILKTAWSELNTRVELMWKIGGRMELHDVLHPYAYKKSKEIGCNTVWDPQTFKFMASGNELERLDYLLEKGIITEDEYKEKKEHIDDYRKQILGG
jgi:hypothetical protein